MFFFHFTTIFLPLAFFALFSFVVLTLTVGCVGFFVDVVVAGWLGVVGSLGFVGSLVLLILYVFLIYRILKITLQSNNQFYTYISIGFIMMLVFHIFENVGAVTGLLPLTGIPLPFISQGGSSIISNLIGIGLVLSIYNHSSKKKEPEDGPPIRKKVVLKKAQ